MSAWQKFIRLFRRIVVWPYKPITRPEFPVVDYDDQFEHVRQQMRADGVREWGR
jgi:hypothetical protein